MGILSPMVSRQRGEVLKALGDDLLKAIPLHPADVWRSTASTAAGKSTQRPSGHPPAHGRLPQPRAADAIAVGGSRRVATTRTLMPSRCSPVTCLNR